MLQYSGISEIELILAQEERKFHLIKLGFMANLGDEIDFVRTTILPTIPDTNYQEWKFGWLHRYYTFRDFRRFVLRCVKEPLFVSSVKNIFCNEIRALREEFPSATEWDNYLCLKGDTISFSLPDSLFERLYLEWLRNEDLLVSDTQQIHLLCRKMARNLFPLSDDYLRDRFMQDDPFFWNKIYARFKEKISHMQFGNESKVLDIWSESCCILNKSVRENKIIPLTAVGMIKYGVGVAKNKNREHVRRSNRDVHKFTDDIELYCRENGVSQPDSFVHYKDEEGRVDNSLLLADVLCNSKHPARAGIVQGLEDKLDILLDHYLNKMSYEEIAYEKNSELDELQVKQEAARLRQEVSRLKIKLRERLINLLNNTY